MYLLGGNVCSHWRCCATLLIFINKIFVSVTKTVSTKNLQQGVHWITITHFTRFLWLLHVKLLEDKVSPFYSVSAQLTMQSAVLAIVNPSVWRGLSVCLLEPRKPTTGAGFADMLQNCHRPTFWTTVFPNTEHSAVQYSENSQHEKVCGW